MKRQSPRANHRAIKHIGFEAAAEKAAKGEGEDIEHGRAMIAAAGHKASKAARARNPKLMKIKGM